MTYTPIAKGTENWDVPLNAALAQLDSNITSASGTALQASNNLSDLTNVPQARANLNLTGLANALSNMTATSDPSVTSDNTQGYSIGSTWFNTTSNALFIASSVATGAAVWLQIPPTFVDRTSAQFVAGNKTFTSNTFFSNAGVTTPTVVTTATSNGGVANRFFVNQTADNAISVRTTGDANSRLLIAGTGTVSWGDGTNTVDTNLYRAGVSQLQTDDTFKAAVITTGTVTPATNFTLNTASVRQTCGSVLYSIVLNYTGTTITADSAGNIGDTLCATLSPAPPVTITVAFDNSGIAGGTATIATNGQVTLKTLAPTATIASGSSINFSAMWL